ncbi:hypothetical protein GN956_G11243 [Arapaima gigas]
MWIIVKRLDLHDDRLTTPQEVSLSIGADTHLNNTGNIPFFWTQLGSCDSKANTFVPKPRIIATNINKSMKTGLQSVVRRMERLEELVPQTKLRHQEKIIQFSDG